MILADAHAETLVTSQDPRWVVVALSGEFDFASMRALGVLDQAVRAHPGAHVLVDLSDVSFMDHTALIAFARAKSRALAGGGVVSLHGASDAADRLLQLWHIEPASSAHHEPDDAA